MGWGSSFLQISRKQFFVFVYVEDVSLDLLCSYWVFPTGLSSGLRSRRRAFLNESVGHVAESVEVLLAVGAGVEVKQFLPH